MKKFIALVIGFSLIIVACTIKKDEALPLSQENIEKYNALVNEELRKIPENSSESSIDIVIKVYKNPLEKTLGYDFDKTFQYCLTHHGDAPGYGRIINDLDESLNKGVISQTTYEYLKLYCESDRLGEEFGNCAIAGRKENILRGLEISEKCQDTNNGRCTLQMVLDATKNELLNDKELIDRVHKYPFNNVPGVDIDVLYSCLCEKYGFDNWGYDGFIQKPDGSEVYFPRGSHSAKSELDTAFVVNKNKMESLRKLIQIDEQLSHSKERLLH